MALQARRTVLMLTFLWLFIAVIVFAAFPSPSFQQSPRSASWVEETLKDHEARLRGDAQDLAVIQERLRENETAHREIEQARLPERMALLEQKFDNIDLLLKLILAAFLPVVFEHVLRLNERVRAHRKR